MSLPSLYFVRHGETAWSLGGRHTGRTDVPLTANGEMQARQLSTSLSSIDFAEILTSPRRRARQTCTFAGLGSSAKVEADLEEWNYGDYEGLTTAEIRTRNPDWNIFTDGCPGGEAISQITDRSDRLIAQFTGRGGNIALFSHGQFGCALAARWIGLDVARGVHFALDTASLSILGPKPAHPDMPVIRRWNSIPFER